MEETEERCESKLNGLQCMLSPGHTDKTLHAAVDPEGLHEWNVGDEAKPAATPDYWNGYWWPDVLKVKDSQVGTAKAWKNQEWRPGREPYLLEYRGESVFSDSPPITHWLEWAAETSLRTRGLRKETDDDYVWRGYALKEIKGALAKYHAKNPQYADEKWYLRAGEIRGTRPSYQGGKEYEPWGGGAEFIAAAVAFGYLPKKEVK